MATAATHGVGREVRSEGLPGRRPPVVCRDVCGWSSVNTVSHLLRTCGVEDSSAGSAAHLPLHLRKKGQAGCAPANKFYAAIEGGDNRRAERDPAERRKTSRVLREHPFGHRASSGRRRCGVAAASRPRTLARFPREAARHEKSGEEATESARVGPLGSTG